MKRIKLLLRLYSTAGTACAEQTGKPFSAIPGPKPLPIIGNVVELNANIKRYNLYTDECFREYGDIFKFSYFGKLNNI